MHLTNSGADDAYTEIRRLATYFYHVEAEGPPGSAREVVTDVIRRLQDYREACRPMFELGESDVRTLIDVMTLRGMPTCAPVS